MHVSFHMLARLESKTKIFIRLRRVGGENIVHFFNNLNLLVVTLVGFHVSSTDSYTRT